MGTPLRLLQAEDSESDAELIVRRLRHAGYDVVSERVQDADAMRAALAAASWDLIVCDYRIPGFDAPAALAVLHESGLDIPFLVVSGAIGEELAVEAMKAGAHDYLMKDNLTRLAAAVDRELREAATRAERRQALRRLQASEAQLALAIQSTGLGVFDHDPASGKTFYSDLTLRQLQMPPDTALTLETFLDTLHPEDRARVERAVRRAHQPESGGHYAEEYRTNAPGSGEDRWISSWGKVLFDAEGKPARFLGVQRDITEQKRAERELQFHLQLTARVTEQSNDCIMLTDPSNMVRFANAEVERVFGLTHDDFQTKTAHELVHHHHPDGRTYPKGECVLAEIIANGGTLRDHEDVLFHKDGTPIDVSVSAVPLELNGARVGTVFTFRDIRQRKLAERALRQSDERFRRLVEAEIIGIMITDGDRTLEINDHFLRLLGYTREEFFAAEITWQQLTPPEFRELSARATRLLRTTGAFPAYEKEYFRKDGTRLPVLVAAVTLNWPEESRIMCFVVDLTERKNLETRFRQAQKLESVGQLAGGVAHDFNNLLTIIMGYAKMGQARIDQNHPFREPLDQISAAAEKAAALTRQLLTFSRMHEGTPQSIALNSLILGIETMLRRLIGAQIEIILSPAAETVYIHADPGLIEQVLINLAVNARDAMPVGGRLFIETSKITVADDFAAQCLSVACGTWVSLGVTDTGTGMTPEVQARLFEPFFTTKEPGKGTGLGLSTVYGIVKQAGGSINVHSTPGLGTSVRILFPAAGKAPAPQPKPLTEAPARGAETVLLVEDETGVRHFVRDVLEEHGYRVLDAATGLDAIETARHYRGPIHILLTDIVLPGMNGAEVIRQFLLLRPGTQVLCMSGYPERFGVQMNSEIPYLQKPFAAEGLLRQIRVTLDSPKTHAPDAGIHKAQVRAAETSPGYVRPARKATRRLRVRPGDGD